MNSELEISEYEDWMLPHIAQLQSEEDDRAPHIIAEDFKDLLLQEGVRDKSIIIVALEENEVVAAQTYMYWPYTYGRHDYFSLQSGGSIVKRQYRGRGLFQKMLGEGTRLATRKGVEFLMGFPVQMSYGAFVNDGWLHLGSLLWLMRPINPVHIAMSKLSKHPVDDGWLQTGSLDEFSETLISRDLRKACSEDLIHMKSEGALGSLYRSDFGIHVFYFREMASGTVMFCCRLTSKHGFREMTIGDILSAKGVSCADLGQALKGLIRAAKENGCIDALTILINPEMKEFRSILRANYFLPTGSKVPFILRLIGDNSKKGPLQEYPKWYLSHSDIDTWYYR